MTIKQINEYLQLNEQTIYKLARSCHIPANKIAFHWKFRKDLIDNWIIEINLINFIKNEFCYLNDEKQILY